MKRIVIADKNYSSPGQVINTSDFSRYEVTFDPSAQTMERLKEYQQLLSKKRKTPAAAHINDNGTWEKDNLEDLKGFYIKALKFASELNIKIIRSESSVIEYINSHKTISAGMIEVFKHISDQAKKAGVKIALESREGILMTPKRIFSFFQALDDTQIGLSVNLVKFMYEKKDDLYRQVKTFEKDRNRNGLNKYMSVWETDNVIPSFGFARRFRPYIHCFYIDNVSLSGGRLEPAAIEQGDIDYILLLGLMGNFIIDDNRYLIVADQRIGKRGLTEEEKYYLYKYLHYLDNTFTHGTSAIKASMGAEGEAFFTPADEAAVNSYIDVTLNYKTGKSGIKSGGIISVGFEANHRCGFPQLYHPRGENYVSIESPNPNVELRATVRKLPVIGLFIEIIKGELKEGDLIKINYGCRKQGSPGFYTGPFVFKMNFNFKIRKDKTSGFKLLDKNPQMNIMADRCESLRILAPSFIKEGAKFSVDIFAEDRSGYPVYSNSITPYDKTIKVICKDKNLDLPVPIYKFKKADSGKITIRDISAEGEGVYYLEVKEKEGIIESVSNPIKSLPADCSGYKIYWGDIHAHSTVSDGLNDIEWMVRYARDYAKVDFMAPADHHGSSTEETWKLTKTIVNKYYKPGEFVTFLGLETEGLGKTGHRNIYFLNEDPPRFIYKDGRYGNLEQMWQYLEGKQAMVILHQPIGIHPKPTHSEKGKIIELNSRFEHLIEIASCHHGNEYLGCKNSFLPMDGFYVRNMLNQGRKFGIMGSSDTHDSHCGYAPYENWRRSPLTAVYANALTREAVWEALYNRRCYATTGPRMIIDFRINGHCMGEEINLEEETTANISVEVYAEDIIKEVVIIKNGCNYQTYHPASKEIKIVCEDNLREKRTDYYYIRIVQENNDMGWTSPIWVTI